jgi:hypothetical protein
MSASLEGVITKWPMRMQSIFCRSLNRKHICKNEKQLSGKTALRAQNSPLVLHQPHFQLTFLSPNKVLSEGPRKEGKPFTSQFCGNNLLNLFSYFSVTLKESFPAWVTMSGVDSLKLYHAPEPWRCQSTGSDAGGWRWVWDSAFLASFQGMPRLQTQRQHWQSGPGQHFSHRRTGLSPGRLNLNETTG